MPLLSFTDLYDRLVHNHNSLQKPEVYQKRFQGPERMTKEFRSTDSVFFSPPSNGDRQEKKQASPGQQCLAPGLVPLPEFWVYNHGRIFQMRDLLAPGGTYMSQWGKCFLAYNLARPIERVMRWDKSHDRSAISCSGGTGRANEVEVWHCTCGRDWTVRPLPLGMSW